MAMTNVKCPICGQMNEGVDLDETEGWVECCRCKNDFVPSEYLHRVMQDMVSIPEVSFKISPKRCKEKSNAN